MTAIWPLDPAHCFACFAASQFFSVTHREPDEVRRKTALNDTLAIESLLRREHHRQRHRDTRTPRLMDPGRRA